MSHCSRCGRPLKDPTATIGPVCAKKKEKVIQEEKEKHNGLDSFCKGGV